MPKKRKPTVTAAATVTPDPRSNDAWELALYPFDTLTKKEKQIVVAGAREGLRRIDPGLNRLLDSFVQLSHIDRNAEREKMHQENTENLEYLAKFYEAEAERKKQMRARGEKFPLALERSRNRFDFGHKELNPVLETEIEKRRVNEQNQHLAEEVENNPQSEENNTSKPGKQQKPAVERARTNRRAGGVRRLSDALKT